MDNNTTSIQPLLDVKDLKMYFKIPRRGYLHAVDGVSFQVNPGETFGLVGESGCGKSTVGNVIMRLLTATGGSCRFKGDEIMGRKDVHTDMAFRRKMQIIFQDPYSSLNSRKSIKQILSEPYEIHRMGGRDKIDSLVRNLCDRVQIPHSLLDHYPHELDGGMRQVVGIARALSLNPEFIVCDEPVSSLDVSVQARIINLLMDIQKEYGLSYLFISHDLSVVRHISNRIGVMYLGQIVEIADVDDIFENAMHPYSIALLSAVAQINLDKKVSRIVLKGDVPSPMNPKPGCRFAPRCWMVQDKCFTESPALKEVECGHCVACHFADQSRDKMKRAVTTSISDI